MSVPREEEEKWNDRKYREGVLERLTEAVAKGIIKADMLTVRRIRDVGTKAIKIEARLLIEGRENLVGASMPTSLREVLELEKEKEEKAEPAKNGAPVVQVAMRVITMPESKI